MKPQRFLLIIALLSFVVLAAYPAFAVVKKKPRIKKPTFEEKVFQTYPQLIGIKDKSLKEQNDIVREYKLPRIQTYCELLDLVHGGYLVRVPDKEKYFYLNSGLNGKKVPEKDCKLAKNKKNGDRRYLTAEALDHLTEISSAYSDNFSSRKKLIRLKITSLVRTLDYQKLLARPNPNAREAVCTTEDRCSAHLTGYAFDISVKGMKQERIFWLAGVLASDIEDHRILATFEPNQKNFHIMVIPRERPLR